MKIEIHMPDRHGHHVVMVCDGQEALEAWAAVFAGEFVTRATIPEAVQDAEAWGYVEPEPEPAPEPCQHPRIYGAGPREGQCTVCGAQVDEPTAPAEVHVPGFGRRPADHTTVLEFAPEPVPWRHFKVLRELRDRRRGVKTTVLAASLDMEVREVRNALKWGQNHKLAEVVGKARGSRWQPSVLLRSRGVVAA